MPHPPPFRPASRPRPSNHSPNQPRIKSPLSQKEHLPGKIPFPTYEFRLCYLCRAIVDEMFPRPAHPPKESDMAFRMIALFLFLALLSACDNSQSIDTQPEP